MKVVNPFFLRQLLSPLIGLADDDAAVEAYSTLNPNDEDYVRNVIRELIVPHALELNDNERERIRLAYRYYLTKGGINFEGWFESLLPPFDPPNDARLFFLWAWEECFPGESYELLDADDYLELVDPDETWKIHLKD
jgi:hypothetical protein